MDGKVGHDATLRTLAAELCDRGYGRAEGRREAEGCLGSLIYGPPVSCAPPGTVHISVANPN